MQAGGQGRELVTPPLDGTILPGITRDSILQLTRSWQEFQVSERYMTLRELSQVSSPSRPSSCAVPPCWTSPVLRQLQLPWHGEGSGLNAAVPAAARPQMFGLLQAYECAPGAPGS